MKPVVIVSAVCMSVAAAMAAETKMKVEELPPAVRSAMKSKLVGATVLGASKEQENGRMTYEVETKRSRKSRDLTFAGNGTLLEVEQEVDLGSIPRPAREAIQKAAGENKIRKVESVTRGDATSYEATVQARGGSHREIAVNADGSTHIGD